MRDDTIKIRWHGRGGQGAITAAKIVANAAFASGFEGVVMTPTFGTERRGAPVMTSLKISKKKIYDLSPIREPDILVIMDHLLLEEAGVMAGLKRGGLIVVNTPKPHESYRFNGMMIATADVTSLGVQAGLAPGIVNSGIIGAFEKAANLVGMETLLNAIEKEFQGRKPDENKEAARLTYSNTILGVQ